MFGKFALKMTFNFINSHCCLATNYLGTLLFGKRVAFNFYYCVNNFKKNIVEHLIHLELFYIPCYHQFIKTFALYFSP